MVRELFFTGGIHLVRSLVLIRFCLKLWAIVEVGDAGLSDDGLVAHFLRGGGLSSSLQQEWSTNPALDHA